MSQDFVEQSGEQNAGVVTERETKFDLARFEEVAAGWINGNIEIKRFNDPDVVGITQATGTQLEAGLNYALVAHGSRSRSGKVQEVIDEIGLIAPQEEWTLVAAGTAPFRTHLEQIKDTPVEDRQNAIWNVWLAPVTDEMLEEGELEITSPWLSVQAELGWTPEQLKENLAKKLGPDHKYKGMESRLCVLPVKYRIGRF